MIGADLLGETVAAWRDLTRGRGNKKATKETRTSWTDKANWLCVCVCRMVERRHGWTKMRGRRFSEQNAGDVNREKGFGQGVSCDGEDKQWERGKEIVVG